MGKKERRFILHMSSFFLIYFISVSWNCSCYGNGHLDVIWISHSVLHIRTRFEYYFHLIQWNIHNSCNSWTHGGDRVPLHTWTINLKFNCFLEFNLHDTFILSVDRGLAWLGLANQFPFWIFQFMIHKFVFNVFQFQQLLKSKCRIFFQNFSFSHFFATFFPKFWNETWNFSKTPFKHLLSPNALRPSFYRRWNFIQFMMHNQNQNEFQAK